MIVSNLKAIEFLVCAIILTALRTSILDATPAPSEEDLAQILAQGTELLKLGRYEMAEEVLAKAVEIDPESASAYALLGRSQALNRRWLRAERSLSHAYEMGQRDLRTLVYLGSAFWENRDFEDAESIFLEAIERFPSSPLAKYQHGRLLLWQGRYNEAVAPLSQAAGRNPAPDILLDLAEALRGAGRYEDAIVAYEQVTLQAPDLMRAHYGLAILLNKAGRVEEAQRELSAYYRLYQADQAAARSSELERGEIDRGRDLLRRSKIEAAIEHLSSLPPSVDSLSVLSEAYFMAGDSRQAIEFLEQAVVMDPGNEELRRRLSETRLAEEGSSD